MHTIDHRNAGERRDQLLKELNRSREHLHHDMTHDASDEAQGHATTTEHPRWTLGSVAAARWWEEHPLHAAALQAESRAREAVQPMADRHPLALVGVAAAVGAVGACLLPRKLRLLAVPYLSAQATGLAMSMTKSFFGGRSR